MKTWTSTLPPNNRATGDTPTRGVAGDMDDVVTALTEVRGSVPNATSDVDTSSLKTDANVPGGVSLGASNGTDDVPAIQAALDTPGVGRVVGKAGQTYVLSTALVIRSGTTLDMTGCTITGNPSYAMLKNASCVPTRTVTDAATTAGSTTVTSATAAFTAADVGKAVGVLGAGPNAGLSTAPGSLYGTITTVTSATAVVLSQAATTSTTGSTLSVWPARDSNITVTGGTWNGGDKTATSQNLNGHGFLFRRVDGINASPDVMTNTRTDGNGPGGGYAISFGDVTYAECAGVQYNTGSDGVHFQGPAKYIHVRDQFGVTRDDLVAFTGVDGQSKAGSLLGDVEGDITDVTVSDVHSNGAWTVLKITSGTGTGGVQRVVSRFTATNLYGTTGHGIINVVDYAGLTWFDGSFSEVYARPAAGYGTLTVKATNAQTVRCRNFFWDSAAGCPTGGVIQVQKPVDVLIVDGLTIKGTTTGTGLGVKLTASVDSLAVSRLSVPDATPTFHAIDVAAASLTVTSLTISQVYKVNPAGALVNVEAVATTATFTDVAVSDGYQTAGSVFASAAASTTTSRLRVANWRQAGGNLAVAASPMEVTLEGVEVAATGGAVQASVAGASPLAVRGSGVTVTSGTLVSRTGTQAVSVNGPSLPVDVSILTPADGHLAFNTNTALGCGAGPAVYNAAAGKWKGLYSGLTN